MSNPSEIARLRRSLAFGSGLFVLSAGFAAFDLMGEDPDTWGHRAFFLISSILLLFLLTMGWIEYLRVRACIKAGAADVAVRYDGGLLNEERGSGNRAQQTFHLALSTAIVLFLFSYLVNIDFREQRWAFTWTLLMAALGTYLIVEWWRFFGLGAKLGLSDSQRKDGEGERREGQPLDPTDSSSGRAASPSDEPSPLAGEARDLAPLALVAVLVLAAVALRLSGMCDDFSDYAIIAVAAVAFWGFLPSALQAKSGLQRGRRKRPPAEDSAGHATCSDEEQKASDAGTPKRANEPPGNDPASENDRVFGDAPNDGGKTREDCADNESEPEDSLPDSDGFWNRPEIVLPAMLLVLGGFAYFYIGSDYAESDGTREIGLLLMILLAVAAHFAIKWSNRK